MTPFPFWNTYSPAGVCLLKSRPSIAALLALELLYGCHDPGAHRPSEIVLVPERTPSFEIAMTANLGSNPRVGTTLEITLRNVGQRTLVFNTGLQRYPMANFAFSFELPTREWLQISCQLCSPASADQPFPYTIRLSPSQFLRFTLPLSTFVAADPRTGTSIDMRTLRGRILIELQVPTPPNAEKKDWPGYVNTFVPLP